MNSLFKHFSFFSDLKNRKNFRSNEIFFHSCSILEECGFSNNLSYFFFKRRNNFVFYTKIKNRCIFSGNPRAVNSKLKMSRHALGKKISTASVPGFYKSVW